MRLLVVGTLSLLLRTHGELRSMLLKHKEVQHADALQVVFAVARDIS